MRPSEALKRGSERVPVKPLTHYEVRALLSGELYTLLNSRDQPANVKDWASAELKRRQTQAPKFPSKPQKVKQKRH
jgi:hypothetical protein